jgi:DNA-binding transcriptional regulator YiaG
MSLYPVTEDEKDISGVVVRMARAALRLDQAAFGARYQYSIAAVKNWEQGKYLPPMSVRRDCLRVVKQAVRAGINLENQIQARYDSLQNRRNE